MQCPLFSMKYILILLILFSFSASSQTIGYMRFDTTKVMKVGGNGELKVQNATRDSLGIFTNYGNGWGQWKRSKVAGSTIIVGTDTLTIPASASDQPTTTT